MNPPLLFRKQARRRMAELLESRVLLSTYALNNLATFPASDGQNPTGSVGVDSEGNLYGVESYSNTIFEVAAGSRAISTLASPGRLVNGSIMSSTGVVSDPDGNLFGTESADSSTVFELAHGSNTTTTIATFSNATGAPPVLVGGGGGLVLDSADNIFGITAAGGANGAGTVFEVPSGSGQIVVLASFATGATSSDSPYGLVVDSNGDLFGTTPFGGANGDGSVFEVAHGSQALTTLASFDGNNGSAPDSLVLDTSGNIFGTTFGGTVFEVARGTRAITDIASFSEANGSFPQGEYPEGGLVVDSSGDLFGAAEAGGLAITVPPGAATDGQGTIFEVAHGTGAVTVIASFNDTDGGQPANGLIADSSGNLLGTAEFGGLNEKGTVFEIGRGSSTITTLAFFGASPAGTDPSGVVVDLSGNVFGTTKGGGPDDVGTLFEIARGTNTVTTLASFDVTNGADPFYDLTLDASGNIFGSTTSGGANDAGTVFEFMRGGNGITTIASLNAEPEYIAIDSTGDIFGTNSNGDANGVGGVFEIAEGRTSVTTLASFTTSTGTVPSGLVLDSKGNLFGSAEDGGADGDGTVFEIASGSNTITDLVSFNSTNVSSPDGLAIDTKDDLFGTAGFGGANKVGAVFEVAAGSKEITVLASLVGATNGGDPFGAVLDSDGNVFGSAGLAAEPNTIPTGTLFEVPAGSGSITTVAPILANEGMAVDASGDIYGTTSDTAFELTPSTSPTPTPTPTPTPLQTGTARVTVVASLPASIVAGTHTKAAAVVTIAAPVSLTGKTGVTLYVSPSQSLTNATQLVSVALKLKLKAGSRKALRFKLSSFPSALQGSYYLIAAVEAPDGTTTAVAGPSLTIAAPVVSILTTKVLGAPASVAPGKKLTLTLTLQNNGNVPGAGTAALNVSLSSSSSAAGGQAVAATTLRVKLKAKHAKGYRVKVVVPAGTTPGSYFLATSLAVSALGDPIAADGIGVSKMTITVT